MPDGYSKTIESSQEARCSSEEGPREGLMFVDATLNGKPMKSVMIDTSTTHNFVSKVEAK